MNLGVARDFRYITFFCNKNVLMAVIAEIFND